MKKLLTFLAMGSVATFVLLFCGTPIHCAIPHMINYQGMLTDDLGDPLSGPHNLTFRIYDDTTGGNLEWNETQNGVQVENGLFNVILGRVTPLNLAFDEQYWLEVEVDSDTMPRLRFTSVAYAYRAQIADSATVAISAPTGGGWTDDGTVVRLETSTDKVGIGTSSPVWELEVANLTAGDGAESAVTANDAGGAIAAYSSTLPDPFAHYAGRVSLFSDAATMGLDLRADGSTSDIRLYTGGFAASNERMRITNTGTVGIGTTSPHDGKLVVANSATDEAYISLQPGGAANNDFVGLRASESGDNTTKLHFGREFTYDFEFIDLVTLDGSTGNVGIGTGSPNYKLDVRGSIGNNTTLYHSDIRWKKNVKTLDNALETTLALRGVQFEWRRDEFPEMNFTEGKRIGLIAQEVETVIPELVATGKDGYKSVEYTNLVALLIEAIKEQQNGIESLKSKTAQLTTSMQRLEELLIV